MKLLRNHIFLLETEGLLYSGGLADFKPFWVSAGGPVHSYLSGGFGFEEKSQITKAVCGLEQTVAGLRYA